MKRFVVLSLLAVAVACPAQITQPGWYNASGFVKPLPGNGGDLFSSKNAVLAEGDGPEGSFPNGTTAIAEAITPEIQALARGLENDPLRIFSYVHDHIRHVLYFGSKKGAQLTLLERSGNDFDQCALLVALLHAAGHTNAGYQFGMLQMPYDSPDHRDLRHWLGLSLVNTNWQTTSNYFSWLFGVRGYPFVYVFPEDTNTFAFPRVWVTLDLGGATHYLDPAFKVSEPVAGIDLPAAMGLDTNALVAAAAGTNTADYVRSLNESALRSKLQSFNTNLLLTLQSSYPNASVKEILGGEEIVPWTNGLSPGLMFPTFTDNGNVPVQSWTYQPTNFMSRIRISLRGYYYVIYNGTIYYISTVAGKTWYFPELQGQRLSLTCSDQSRVILWVGDSAVPMHFRIGESDYYVSEAIEQDSTFPLTVTVNHPYGGWDPVNNIPVATGTLDSSVSLNYPSANASYALVYAFEPDEAWLRQRQQQLDSYRQQGYADTSREVVTETLNVMGMNWMIQTRMSADLVTRQGQVLPQYHVRFGRMAQELGAGYYIDAYLQQSALFPGTGAEVADLSRECNVADIWCYTFSAQEHALIEQLQAGGLVAASTVKLLQLANSRGQAVYLANSNNWTTGANVRSKLVNYDLGALDSLISQGYSLLLPTNGAIPVAGAGSWTGRGYVEHLATSSYARSIRMMISGGYNGGFVSSPTAIPDPAFVSWNALADPLYLNRYSAFTRVTLDGDPVNMADASFRLTESDLALGHAEPRGINFTRHYSPTRRHLNQANMANGWTHNYCFDLDETSAPEASLGGTTPAQMAPMLVASCAALNLYNPQPDPRNWMVTALIAKWGVDQTISNAVSIVMGDDTIQFIKQPDGTFTPPANCTMSLTKGSTYQLKERRGNAFNFNSTKQLTTITNPSGNSLTLTYGSGRLSRITDWQGRQVNFTYSGTPARLTRIYDNISPTRSVYYGYSTNTHGNLDLVWVSDPESKTNRYLYDAGHQMTATFDAFNRLVVSNLYDSFGRVTTQYTQGDPAKQWQYFWSGWQTVVQDPAGAKHHYFYDDKTRQIGEQDALGNRSRTFYDGQDHVVMTVSPLNETNRFLYDSKHNLTQAIDSLGFTNRFLYDGQNNLVQFVDARGHTNRFGYSARFQLTGLTNGAGDWVTFGYNAADGTLTGRTNPAGVTAYAYDGNGHLNRITYPGALGSESFVNNARGDVTSHTDARNFVTTFQYDQRRQLTNVVAPTNLTVRIAWDPVGNIQRITDARNFSTTNVWSATRKLLATILPATPQGVPAITNIYDNRDWLLRTIYPQQSTVHYTNDVAGRLVAVTDPVQRPTRFGFDAAGRLTATTNAAQETSRLQWSPRSELLRTTDGANRTLLSAFDAVGNQVTLTNRNGKVWQFQYDAANRLTNTISPLNRETQLAYDNRGLLKTAREPSGQMTTNHFDPKGRLTNRVDAVGSTTYRYDANNNITNVVESGKTNTWTFDAYDRISSYRDADGNLIQYRYDANHNLTNLVYPGGRTVRYFYDSLNQLTNVTDWANRQTRFEYDLAGRLRKITRPNGTIREINYDAAGQTTNIWEKTAGGEPIVMFRLGWNAAERVDWEFAAPPPRAYTPPVRTMTFDDDNRLETFNGQNVVHDDDGNLTTGPLTNNTLAAYSYDARNRLLNVGQSVPPVSVSYACDALDNRVGVTNNGVATRFVIDPNTALSQVLMRVKGGVTNYYVYGAGLLYEVTESGGVTNTLTYHYDYRGSTVALTDHGSRITDRFEYSAYGTTTYRTGTNDTPFLFNGRYGVQTDANGLLNMRARYYNPHLCRFVNADPIGFAGGLNFYAYADGNPVSLIDPFGLGAVESDVMKRIRQAAYEEAEKKMKEDLIRKLSYVPYGIDFDPTVKHVPEPSHLAILSLGVPGPKFLRTKGTLQAGQAGRFSTLESRAVVGDSLTPHHMPQAALGFTSRAEGGAIVVSQSEHVLTRTYGFRGAQLAVEEAGVQFRTVLVRDIRDLRRIVGSKYNQGIQDLLEYYREFFSGLISKPK